VKTYDPAKSVALYLNFRREWGAVQIVSIDPSEPRHIGFTAQQTGTGSTMLGDLTLGATDPPQVQRFLLMVLGPQQTAVQVTVDAALRRRVIDGIEKNLADFYVDAALADEMNRALEAHAKAGEYDATTGGNAFAAKLTDELQVVSKDKHLRVDFDPVKMPGRGAPGVQDRERVRANVLHDNCAFTKVEILAGNVGYLKFHAFMPPDICGPTVAAAMAFVAHTDALILDLRENHGGDPAMVSFVASYFFDQATHLNDLYDRHENSTTQFWTLSYVPGERLVQQPVFLLTSKGTFSGAEEFAYDLKNRKRAIMVGEATGGGAHPVAPHVVADYFIVAVPFAQAINPVTKTNWEGVGVEPDVKVAADDALATAQKLANEKIQPNKNAK
jgi:hypothetical protein